MAWRAKTFLLACALFSLGFLVLQGYVRIDVGRFSNGRVAFLKAAQFRVPKRKSGNDNMIAHARLRRPMSDFFPNDGAELYESSTSSPSLGMMQHIHDERIRKLKSACASSAELRITEVKKANLTELYFSRAHNFAYCKVPKSGSTFWMNVFMLLTRGENITNSLSRMSRMEIHDTTRSLRVNPVTILQENIPTVVVARNPYARLFSAYIDKVYLPLFWEQFSSMNGTKTLPWINKTATREFLRHMPGPIAGRLLRYKDQLIAQGLIVHRNVTVRIQPVCAKNATFGDFLTFIVNLVKLNVPLETHWAPISHLCRPCRMNTFKVVKQESFAADVEYTLNSVGLNISNYEWLRSSLNEKLVENTVPGIVAVVDSRLKLNHIKICINDSETAKRLWKTFQIQGFISDKSEVPKRFNEVDFVFNATDVTNDVLDAVRTLPLSTTESQRQRRRYLVNAFKEVSERTLEAILNIYRLDFNLFGYPTKPPT